MQRRFSLRTAGTILAPLLFMGCASMNSARPHNKAQLNPQAPIPASYRKGEITKLCDEAIIQLRKQIAEISTRAPKDRSFENTVLALDTVLSDFSDQTSPLGFMKDVSMDKDLRDEGASCEEKSSKASIDIFTDKKLYEAVKSQKPQQTAVRSKALERGATVKYVNRDHDRLYSEFILGFEHNGLKLSDEKLAQFKELKKELASLQTEFAKNLGEDVSTVTYTAEELEGVPADYIGRLKKTADGKIIVPTKEPDYMRLTQNATREETRKRFLDGYLNRQAEKNTPLLEKAIMLRQKLAALLGYKTWADAVISTDHMAKNGQEVLNFLNGLRDKLKIRNQKDLAHMLEYKKKLDPKATALNYWDLRYLDYQIKKNEYSVDDEEVRPYFPADIVIKGMFEVYSTLLSVDYVEVQHADVWSPDVKLYEIHDKSNNELIGYFYADFIPRDGKYGHAAAFPLISGRMIDGHYSKPVASIVANFNAPTADKPSLLSHDDVETVFHEFGHIMHQTLTRAPYGSLSGSSVAQDFVEAPSQMLENWVWQTEILQKLSGHYQDHSKKLPKDLLDKIIKLHDVNRGYFYTRQLWLGLTDMTYHTTKGPVNTTEVMGRLHQELTSIQMQPGAHFQASFGHLMGGYDAGYYGYLWSEVYAQDMFTRFEGKNILSSKVGADYRHWILEAGNMREAKDLVTGFIGRKLSFKAFFRKLGIKE